MKAYSKEAIKKFSKEIQSAILPEIGRTLQHQNLTSFLPKKQRQEAA
jgi:hypothetical protein